MDELFITLGNIKFEDYEDPTILILDKIDSKRSIPEIILFLERYKISNTEEWLKEFEYYLVEIRVDKSILNSFTLMKEYFTKYPRVLLLTVHGLIFILQILVDINITHFYQTNLMEQDFVDLYQRIVTTVFHSSMKLLMKNWDKLNNFENWKTVEKDDNPNLNGEKLIDFGAWDEYYEYLEKTKVLTLN